MIESRDKILLNIGDEGVVKNSIHDFLLLKKLYKLA